MSWPTLVTLAMFPFLTAMYAFLARREEAEARAALGTTYERYAATTPAFIPQWRNKRMTSPTNGRGRLALTFLHERWSERSRVAHRRTGLLRDRLRCASRGDRREAQPK